MSTVQSTKIAFPFPLSCFNTQKFEQTYVDNACLTASVMVLRDFKKKTIQL